jgi:hypothetical protein
VGGPWAHMIEFFVERNFYRFAKKSTYVEQDASQFFLEKINNRSGGIDALVIFLFRSAAIQSALLGWQLLHVQKRMNTQFIE